MKIEQCEFEDVSFRERAVKDPLHPELATLMMPLTQRRLVLVTGAGVSIPSPTSLPSGTALASELVSWLRQNGMNAIADQASNPTDLGEVCEVIEGATNRGTLIAELTSNPRWRTARFNLCHLAVALFFAEGLLERSFTFNWDGKTLQASLIVEGGILSCPCDTATLGSASSPMFVHLHGSIEHPDTLVLSRNDIDGPDSLKWALPQLQAAITSSEVALIGFAVEPAYLIDSLVEMKDTMGRPPLAVVTVQSLDEFKNASPRLAEACGLNGDEGRLIQQDSCEVLGELLRARYGQIASRMIEGALERAAVIGGTQLAPSDDGKASMQTILLDRSLRQLMRLTWQAAALPSEDPEEVGLPVLASYVEPWAEVLALVLTLVSCSDVSRLEGRGDGLRVHLEDSSLLDLWPILPISSQSAASSCSHATNNSHLFSTPGDAHVPLVLLVSGSWGSPLLGHASLVGDRGPTNLVQATRRPADALNLQDLQARIGALADEGRPRVAQIVRLEGQNGG